MPLDSWTLTIGSVTQKLGNWGVTSALLTLDGIVDTLQLNCGTQNFDAVAIGGYNDPCTLRSPDGIIRFVGYRRNGEQSMDGASEGRTYTFKGPGVWFEEHVFHKTWPFVSFTGTPPNQTVTPFTEETSELYLNFNPQTNLLTSVGTQIAEVINYAITNGANMQLGITSALTVTPMASLVNDMQCIAVIQNQLVWAPDASPWFDYTTTPPTLHFYGPSQLEQVIFDIKSLNSEAQIQSGIGPYVVSVDVTRLDDQAVPAIVLRYRFTNSENDRTYVTRSTDIYPPGSTGKETLALSKTIDLNGQRRTFVEADIESEELPDTDLGKLRLLFPWIAEGIDNGTISASSITVTRTTIDGAAGTLPNRIIVGSPAAWMPIDYVKERVKVSYSFVRTQSGVQLENVAEVDSVDIITTDSEVGVQTYQRITSVTDSDPVPVGLAEYLYNALNGVQYEGAIRLEGLTCSFFAGLASKVSVSGTNDVSVAAMNATPRRIVHDLLNGATTIQFSPRQGLGLDRILELLRSYRAPRRWVAGGLWRVAGCGNVADGLASVGCTVTAARPFIAQFRNSGISEFLKKPPPTAGAFPSASGGA